MPISEVHSVGGVLVHMPHVSFEIPKKKFFFSFNFMCKKIEKKTAARTWSMFHNV